MIWKLIETSNTIPVIPYDWCEDHNCHLNVDKTVSILGGHKITGFYLLHSEILDLYQAIRHSVWKIDNEVIDVTPNVFNTLKISFFPFDIFYKNIFFKDINVINNFNLLKQETEMTYYVYGLIDVRNGLPFYIGKGKDKRAECHLEEKNILKYLNRKDKWKRDRKFDKIISLQNQNIHIEIVKYAENIENETFAYEIEEKLILFYGREGIESHGILTNVCLGSNPLNHKNKSYIEIHGEEKAKQLIEYKRQLQLAAGGYGPKVFSEEHRRKLSEKCSGKNNPRYGVIIKGTNTAKKISEANRGKKHYSRSSLLAIEDYKNNKIYYIYMNDLKDFCNKRGNSSATFQAQLGNGWGVSKRGKNKDMKCRKASIDEKLLYDSGTREVELSSYTSGGIKQDLSEDKLKGFSL